MVRAEQPALAILLGLAFCCQPTVAAYDESVWTRQWQSFQLRFPAHLVLPSEPGRTGFALSSLSGPYDPELYGVPADDESGREGPFTRAERGAAIGAVQCQACAHLVARLWQLGCDWVHRESGLPDFRSTKRQLRFAQHTQVPQTLLKEVYVASNRAGADKKDQPPRFHLLPRSEKTGIQEYEEDIVREACKAVVEGNNSEKGSLLSALRAALKAYLNEWLSVVEELERPFDSKALAGCSDLEPRCLEWAAGGECQINPKYMMGDGSADKGHCHLSCATCQPVFPPGLPEHLSKRLKEASDSGLAALKRSACQTRPFCSAQPPAGAHPQGATSPPQTLALSAPPPAASRSSALRRQTAPASITWSEQVKLVKALGPALQKNCVLQEQGYWTYEVCVLERIRQLHLERGATVVLKLGQYDAAATEDLVNSEPDLRPMQQDPSVGFHRPYIRQVYTNGDVCEETGKPRHTVLVIACPLQGRQPLFISETSPCAYFVILYHAALCDPWTETIDSKAELAFQDEL
ncbi:hypothetical protein WJX73_003286 [Symbiochloris irregularis]|uniref:MRH domain-containing protein n=1 Tax=Symbiochloris irregularis TaxID=706552 RepID=A0AAW1PT38_9CHLO